MAEPENKTDRVQLLMAPSEVASIDNWGFEHRIRTRAEAIRRLCQIGLAYDKHAGELLIMNGKLMKAIGALHEAKGDMFTGKVPVDLEVLDKMIDDTLRQAVIASLAVMAISQRHVPLSRFSGVDSLEETIESFTKLSADLSPNEASKKS